MQIGNESARELGPLKYMAELTNKPMEQIVNWFMLLIIFVFDPLAITMVVAANMAFAKIKPKKKNKDVTEAPSEPLIEVREKEVIKEVVLDDSKLHTEIEKIKRDLEKNNIMKKEHWS
jgi:hypothetical protein